MLEDCIKGLLWFMEFRTYFVVVDYQGLSEKIGKLLDTTIMKTVEVAKYEETESFGIAKSTI